MADLTADVEAAIESADELIQDESVAAHVRDLIRDLADVFAHELDLAVSESEMAYDDGYLDGRSDLEMDLMDCEEKIEALEGIL